MCTNTDTPTPQETHEATINYLAEIKDMIKERRAAKQVRYRPRNTLEKKDRYSNETGQIQYLKHNAFHEYLSYWSPDTKKNTPSRKQHVNSNHLLFICLFSKTHSTNALRSILKQYFNKMSIRYLHINSKQSCLSVGSRLTI